MQVCCSIREAALLARMDGKLAADQSSDIVCNGVTAKHNEVVLQMRGRCVVLVARLWLQSRMKGLVVGGGSL